MLLLRLLTVCLVFFAPMQAYPFDDLNDKNQGRHPKIIEISEGSKLKACYVKALSDLSERDTAFFLKIGDFDSKKNGLLITVSKIKKGFAVTLTYASNRM